MIPGMGGEGDILGVIPSEMFNSEFGWDFQLKR